jgi:hypothetical protein
MCQACLILASRRSGDAASSEAALWAPRPARFAAVAEWADAPAEAESEDLPAANSSTAPRPKLAPGSDVT